jgi:SAM-dependent methyltransferase
VAGVSDAAMFRTPPEAYDRHIGRYSAELARGLVELAGVAAGHEVLDVGCGTGLLTVELATVVGGDHVSAVDPSEPFATTCRRRVPEADVRVAAAEQLPFADRSFDRVLSQLVLTFLDDQDAGVREMVRVTRPGGTVATCVWDYAGEMTLLRAFWDAAGDLDPAARDLDEGVTMGPCNPDRLLQLWASAGLTDVRHDVLTPSVRYADFEELWGPLSAGAGPAGAYAARLDAARRRELHDNMHGRLGAPAGEFVLTARAWAIAGTR